MMSKSLSWKIILLLVLLVILALIFYRTPTKPCNDIITYRIGEVDEKFGLTRQEFAVAVNLAAAMWGKPLGRDLFREDSRGTIEINLVYDYRQESSDKLKKLNYRIENTKNSYDELKARLTKLKSEYDERNGALTGDIKAYDLRITALNNHIEHWNRKGGADAGVRKGISEEKDDLDALRIRLENNRKEISQLADTIKSLVVVVNEIATNINLDLVDYQKTGGTLGAEFCEGFYENKNSKQKITIYQFDNEYRLVRVLAHELGHALGVKHSDDRNAVMYRLMQSDIIELAPSDFAALQKRCNQ